MSDPRTAPVANNRAEIVAMWRSGATLQQVGDRYRVSRERIRQLLRGWGETKGGGGSAFRHLAKCSAKTAERDQRYLALCGCDFKAFKQIRHARPAFNHQRTSAKSRGLPWGLTLKQWWDIWAASGKWELRGRRRGQYCMGRVKDSGGYVIGNVYITSVGENIREARAQSKPMHDDPTKRGVWHLYKGRARGFVARIGKKTIGYFATAAEAQNARQLAMAA